MRPIDVVVLTPLNIEMGALRAELGPADDEGVSEDGSYAFRLWENVDFKDKDVGGSLLAVIPSDKDQLTSANTVHIVLDQWQPRCFALMGIAGQLSNKVNLGDVVVGRHILQWDSKRKELAEPINESQAVYSLTPVRGADWGVHATNLFMSDDINFQGWIDNCAADCPIELLETSPALYIEDIASGSATIDSSETREMLSNISRHLYIVESEAAGAMSALHSRSPAIASIVIRGVSDASTGKDQSDAIGGGSWRKYAARNAAKLLIKLFRLYRIPSHSPLTYHDAYNTPGINSNVNELYSSRGDTFSRLSEATAFGSLDYPEEIDSLGYSSEMKIIDGETVEKLKRLTDGEFGELLRDLHPDARLYVSHNTSKIQQVNELIQWVESPGGPGSEKLYGTIKKRFPNF